MFGSASPLGFGIHFSLRENTTAPATKIKNNINSIRGAAKNASGIIESSLGSITTGFFAVAFAATTLLGPFAAAIKKNNEFERVLSSVQAKSRASAEQMEQLRSQALQLGDATQFSAKQVAEGQEFLAMAGFSVNAQLKAMPGLLDLAAAGQIGLARASDIASNILTQFRLEADQMNRVSDVMALTATSANTSIEQMADAMKFLGPTAASLGVSLEESSAAIGILGNSGLQGSLATRALGTGILRLTKPTKDMVNVMNQLGFSAFNSQGNFVGLANMIELLNKKTAGLTQQQRQGALATLFGAEAIQEINSLMNASFKIQENGREITLKGAEAIRAFTNQLENAEGAAARMAEIQLNNLAGDLTIAAGVFETTMIQIGAALAPVLRPIVQGFTAILKVVKQFIATPVGKFVVQVAAGLAVLTTGLVAFHFVAGTLIPVLTGLAASVWAVMSPLLPFIGIAALVVAGFMAIKKGIESANPRIATFTAIIGIMLGPVTAMITLFMLAKRAVGEFNKFMEGGTKATGFIGFLQKVGGVMVGISEIFKSVTDEGFSMSSGVNRALEQLGVADFVVALGTWIVRIRSFFVGVKEGFVEAFTPVFEIFDQLKIAFGPVFDSIGDFLNSIGFNLNKNTSAISSWREAGRLAGHAMTLALQPVLIVLKAISAVITFVTDAIDGFRSEGFIGGIRNLFGNDDVELPRGDDATFRPTDPTGILNQIAQNRADGATASGGGETRIENNTTESLKNVNLSINMDGKEVAGNILEIIQDEDDRK